MTSITTLSKKHFDAELLFADTDSLTNEIKSKDVMKNFLGANTCLTAVTIQRIQSFLIQLIKNLLVKGKTCLKEK